jgi:hypothetical protein
LNRVLMFLHMSLHLLHLPQRPSVEMRPVIEPRLAACKSAPRCAHPNLEIHGHT